MRKALKIAGIGFLSIFVLLTIAGTITVIIQNQKPAVKASVQPVCIVDAGKLLGYINGERSRLGAPQLIVDTTLAQASKMRSDDMVAAGYFAHVAPSGKQWYETARSLGVKATIDEDIGSNDNTPEQSWQEFKDSKEHYASLINPKYIRVGISTLCTNYTLTKAVDSSDQQYLGTKITDLTVITLATEEPQSAPKPVSCNTTNYGYYGSSTYCN